MKHISHPVLSSYCAAWWEPHAKTTACSNPLRSRGEPLLSTNTTKHSCFLWQSGITDTISEVDVPPPEESRIPTNMDHSPMCP